ncbi:MAG: acyl carrier protein [Deltaproteobacteria bacterium]|nr:acyl carrier protein [Deltaproteobacteria bacterium]MCX7952438.1 acyl carrier protein [Deltaproteobacteria bacterium]
METVAGTEEISSRVRNIIAEQLGVPLENIKDSSRFMDDLGADSLDIVELIMALEEQFDLEISDQEAEKIQTVGDAIEFIQRKKSEA